MTMKRKIKYSLLVLKFREHMAALAVFHRKFKDITFIEGDDPLVGLIIKVDAVLVFADMCAFHR